MSGNPLSQNPRVASFIHALMHTGRFRYVRERDEEDYTCINIVCSELFTSIGVDTLELAAHLLNNGYKFVDQTYLDNGLIHAKYDNEFDIWADCRDSVEPFRPLTVDFSADFIFDEGTIWENDMDSLLREFNLKIQSAIKAFDLSLQGFHTRPTQRHGHRHLLAENFHLFYD
jgi:hypothetical protein